MIWTCTIDGHTLVSEEMNAGQWEQLYLLVNQAGLPHTEEEIYPSHCPTCRNMMAAATLSMFGRVTIEVAAARVASMSRLDLLECFIPPEVPAVDDAEAAI